MVFTCFHKRLLYDLSGFHGHFYSMGRELFVLFSNVLLYAKFFSVAHVLPRS